MAPKGPRTQPHTPDMRPEYTLSSQVTHGAAHLRHTKPHTCTQQTLGSIVGSSSGFPCYGFPIRLTVSLTLAPSSSKAFCKRGRNFIKTKRTGQHFKNSLGLPDCTDLCKCVKQLEEASSTLPPGTGAPHPIPQLPGSAATDLAKVSVTQ